MEGHSSIVLGVAVTPDGKKVVSCSDDATVRIWDLASGVSARISQSLLSLAGV